MVAQGSPCPSWQGLVLMVSLSLLISWGRDSGTDHREVVKMWWSLMLPLSEIFHFNGVFENLYYGKQMAGELEFQGEKVNAEGLALVDWLLQSTEPILSLVLSYLEYSPLTSILKALLFSCQTHTPVAEPVSTKEKFWLSLNHWLTDVCWWLALPDQLSHLKRVPVTGFSRSAVTTLGLSWHRYVDTPLHAIHRRNTDPKIKNRE